MPTVKPAIGPPAKAVDNVVSYDAIVPSVEDDDRVVSMARLVETVARGDDPATTTEDPGGVATETGDA